MIKLRELNTLEQLLIEVISLNKYIKRMILSGGRTTDVLEIQEKIVMFVLDNKFSRALSEVDLLTGLFINEQKPTKELKKIEELICSLKEQISS